VLRVGFPNSQNVSCVADKSVQLSLMRQSM
jgi:hypothetical protein